MSKSCPLENSRNVRNGMPKFGRQEDLYLEHLPCGVLIVEESGQISYSNLQASEILGYSKKEFSNMQVEELVPENERIKHRGLRNGFTADPQPRSMGKGKDLYAVKKDGKTISVEIGLAPLQEEDSFRVICCISDMTRRKMLEEKLQRYTMELERSNSELDTFAYTVSHDLKEPLRAMMTVAEFLEEDYGEFLGYRGKEYLKRLVGQGMQMGQLIDTLLNYSRVGRTDVKTEPVDVTDIVKQAKSRLQVLIGERNATVAVTPPLPLVKSDKTLLTEVFYNLICNGIKHNASDEIKIHVAYDPSSEAFFVEDNGIGIPKDKREEVFHLFSKLQKPVPDQGAGAGMAIVKKIVDKLGGKIWIDSKVGQGTKIYLQLAEKCEDDE